MTGVHWLDLLIYRQSANDALPTAHGGLFDDGAALPLEAADIETVLAASDLDWSEIDPSILGTLFERGLDPGKRAQLGAHYTDRDKIMLLVEPVKPLDTIECRDAILAPDSAEPDWPKADVVIVADPKGVIVAGETRYKAAVRGGPHPSDRCSSQLRWNPGS